MRILISGSISLFVFIASFIIFIVNYNKVATHFLTEGEKMDNADYIITVTVPSFFVLSLLLFFVINFLLKKSN